MPILRKILGETFWTLKLELSEQILERLYEHRQMDEYLTLTDAFDNVSFENLYEKASILQQSKLIEFYTAPEAYAVFKEPDFIRAKIRAEGIQYWDNHVSFLRKHKATIGIALGGLALIASSYLIYRNVNKDRNLLSEDSTSQQATPGSTLDSLVLKSNSPTTSPPVKSLPTIDENRTKPKKTVNEPVKNPPDESVKERTQKDAKVGSLKKERTEGPNVAADLKNNYAIEFDTLNHIVKILPRDGQWDSTVLAIPLSEMEFVHPEFQAQSKALEGPGFAFDAYGLRFSGVMSSTSPAPEGLNYSLHYVNKPTVFLFGSYPNRLHRFYFGNDKQ